MQERSERAAEAKRGTTNENDQQIATSSRWNGVSNSLDVESTRSRFAEDRDLPATSTGKTAGIESAGCSATRARELSRYGAAMIHARYVKLVSRRTAWPRNRASIYEMRNNASRAGETRPGYKSLNSHLMVRQRKREIFTKISKRLFISCVSASRKKKERGTRGNSIQRAARGTVFIHESRSMVAPDARVKTQCGAKKRRRASYVEDPSRA